MSSTTELWTLYAVAVSVTALRTYARVKAVGVREFHPDDWLIWLAVLIYTAQCTLGYHIGIAAHGLDNSGMTPAQRSALSPGDPEHSLRVIGSKIQVAGWTCAVCLLWTLKTCIAFFYLRLTSGLQLYQTRIYIALGLLAITFIANILTIFLSCRPFNHYWQITPDPGNVCQAAISRPIVWVSFVTNVTTDAYLLMIPIPMLWRSSLRLVKKIAATLVLGAGALVIVCAFLKSVYVIVDPIMGGLLAAEWGTRETFVATITTNLPMIFPLLKTWLLPFVPSTCFSSNNNNKAYKSPSGGFVTIGGGGGTGGGASSRNRRGTSTHGNHDTADLTFDNDSEEFIVKGGGDIRLADLPSPGGKNDIVVKHQVSVTTEDRRSDKSADYFHPI